MFADLGQVSYGLDDLLGHKFGVGRQEADTFDAVYVIEPGEKVGQVGCIRKVITVSVYGLTQQSDLFHASGGESLHFQGDLWDGAAHLSAAAVGDDAKGAHQIASVDDGHMAGNVGPVGSQWADAAFPVDAESISYHLQTRLKLLGPHEHIHVRKATG